MSRREQTGAYDAAAPSDRSGQPVEERIAGAMRFYLSRSLGWKPEAVEQRVGREIARAIPKGVMALLLEHRVDVAGKRVLDLGAGLGGLSAEIAERGGEVFAIEPGTVWRALASARLAEAGSGAVVGAVGESLPFADASFDVIVSLQVLEHVQNPGLVLTEAFRVLRPGGCFYLACENYLSFREQHYRIAWLPLLPKPLGRVYLRLRGRPPQFLRQITYVTVVSVRRGLRRSGFVLQRELELASPLGSPGKIANPWKRVVVRAAARILPAAIARRILLHGDTLRRLCAVGVGELCWKPGGVRPVR